MRHPGPISPLDLSYNPADIRDMPDQTLLSLGKIHDTDMPRDAIHVAVAQVRASHVLRPGQHVGFVGTSAEGIVCSDAEPLIGIVDPYLPRNVEPGEQFWMFLYPATITALNHHWSHPAFDSTTSIAGHVANRRASEEWLRNFCETADCPGYEAVMAAITGAPLEDVDGYGDSYRVAGEYLHFSGRDAHGDIPDEFWVHAENVVGRRLRAHPRYFSCSC